MISKNGTTWTDPKETLEYGQKFRDRYKGQTIAEPLCDRCGDLTCYIVEDVKIGQTENPKTKEVKSWAKFNSPGVRIFASNVSFILEDGMAFFVIKECSICNAKDDGFHIGRDCGADMGEKKLRIERAKRNLTEDEFKRWLVVFNEAFDKGRGAFDKAEAKRIKKGSVSQYMPKAKTSEENSQETLI